jgi:hypothetical protein
LPPKTKNSILAASRSRKDASLASLHHQPVLCSRPLASASAPALAKSPAPRKRPALPTEARSQVPGARSQEPGARARCQSQCQSQSQSQSQCQSRHRTTVTNLTPAAAAGQTSIFRSHSTSTALLPLPTTWTLTSQRHHPLLLYVHAGNKYGRLSILLIPFFTIQIHSSPSCYSARSDESIPSLEHPLSQIPTPNICPFCTPLHQCSGSATAIAHLDRF